MSEFRNGPIGFILAVYFVSLDFNDVQTWPYFQIAIAQLHRKKLGFKRILISNKWVAIVILI